MPNANYSDQLRVLDEDFINMLFGRKINFGFKCDWCLGRLLLNCKNQVDRNMAYNNDRGLDQNHRLSIKQRYNTRCIQVMEISIAVASCQNQMDQHQLDIKYKKKLHSEYTSPYIYVFRDLYRKYTCITNYFIVDNPKALFHFVQNVVFLCRTNRHKG